MKIFSLLRRDSDKHVLENQWQKDMQIYIYASQQEKLRENPKKWRNPPCHGECPLGKGGNFAKSVFKMLKSKIGEVYPLFFGTTTTTKIHKPTYFKFIYCQEITKLSIASYSSMRPLQTKNEMGYSSASWLLVRCIMLPTPDFSKRSFVKA